MNATITPVCPLPLMTSLALGFHPLSLSPLSLLSLSPSQVNCSHVIKRPSLYPLTLVNEKMGNKKQFCAANMEKIDNRERCVRLSPLMSEHRHQSRTHRKYSAADGTLGSLCFSRSDTFLSVNTAGFGPRRCWWWVVFGDEGLVVVGGGVCVQRGHLDAAPDKPATLRSCMRPARLVKWVFLSIVHMRGLLLLILAGKCFQMWASFWSLFISFVQTRWLEEAAVSRTVFT